MLRIWTLFKQFSLPTNWWQRSAIQIDKGNKNEKFAEAQVLETEKSLYFKQLWTFGFDENQLNIQGFQRQVNLRYF